MFDVVLHNFFVIKIYAKSFLVAAHLRTEETQENHFEKCTEPIENKWNFDEVATKLKLFTSQVHLKLINMYQVGCDEVHIKVYASFEPDLRIL